MIKYLEQIRTSKKQQLLSRKIVNTLIILLLGIALGTFSKWLDNLAIDDTILWQHILGMLDLGNILSMFGIWLLLALCISIYSNTPIRAALNVFLFFLGMNISYHLYTIYFSGFNPMSYMMIWYGITLLSPFIAFVVWYAKGNGKISLLIKMAIISVMILCSFSIGLWYFYFTSILNTIIFIITVFVLYDNPKKSVFSLISGLIIAYFVRIFV